MYSGFISSRRTISWLGAHQKFNRAAFSLIENHIDTDKFPLMRTIMKFEGYNGPDGLKIKSSGIDEPSHFYRPLEASGGVLTHIDNHYISLVTALENHDFIRAAFEASWLAHAVCDGLTPAHHHDLEAHVCQINGQGRKVKNKRDKLMIKGDNPLETLQQTFKLIGAKGALTNHVHFEMGVTFAVISSSFASAFEPFDLVWARHLGPLQYFQQQALRIDRLSLYERFCERGWTLGLARSVKRDLAPIITETIAAMWLLAYEDAFGDFRAPALNAPTTQTAFALAES